MSVPMSATLDAVIRTAQARIEPAPDAVSASTTAIEIPLTRRFTTIRELGPPMIAPRTAIATDTADATIRLRQMGP
jgi:hypothetical protein